jgi:hypothetical protein
MLWTNVLRESRESRAIWLAEVRGDREEGRVEKEDKIEGLVE